MILVLVNHSNPVLCFIFLSVAGGTNYLKKNRISVMQSLVFLKDDIFLRSCFFFFFVNSVLNIFSRSRILCFFDDIKFNCCKFNIFFGWLHLATEWFRPAYWVMQFTRVSMFLNARPRLARIQSPIPVIYIYILYTHIILDLLFFHVLMTVL